MQFVFQYDYGSERDAIKQAKKMRHGSAFLWVVQHPKSKRYKVIEGENVSDRPSRVRVLWEYIAPPPREPGERDKDRDNLSALAQEIVQDGCEDNNLARAVLEYLEKYQ